MLGASNLQEDLLSGSHDCGCRCCSCCAGLSMTVLGARRCVGGGDRAGSSNVRVKHSGMLAVVGLWWWPERKRQIWDARVGYRAHARTTMKGGGGGAADKQMECCGLQVAGLLAWGPVLLRWSGDGSGAPRWRTARLKTARQAPDGGQTNHVCLGCWPADETKRLLA